MISACYEASYQQSKDRVCADLKRSHSFPNLGQLSYEPLLHTLGTHRCTTEDPSLGGKSRKVVHDMTQFASRPHNKLSIQQPPQGLHEPVVSDTSDADLNPHVSSSVQAASRTASGGLPSVSVILDIAVSTALPPNSDAPPVLAHTPPAISITVQSAGPEGGIVTASLPPSQACMLDRLLAILSCGMWKSPAQAKAGGSNDSASKCQDNVCSQTATQIQERLRSTVTSKLSLAKVGRES